MIITGLQANRAYRLAAHYGHLWAEGVYREAMRRLGVDGGPIDAATAHNIEATVDEMLTQGVALDDIVAWSEAAQGDRPVPGIDCPSVGDGGSIVHTTGTGRLTWMICRDGMTFFNVHRPGDRHILTGRVDPDGSWDCDYGPDAAGGANVRWRHVVALAEAMRVLVPGAEPEGLFPEVAEECVADLLERLDGFRPHDWGDYEIHLRHDHANGWQVLSCRFTRSVE